MPPLALAWPCMHATMVFSALRQACQMYASAGDYSHAADLLGELTKAEPSDDTLWQNLVRASPFCFPMSCQHVVRPCTASWACRCTYAIMTAELTQASSCFTPSVEPLCELVQLSGPSADLCAQCRQAEVRSWQGDIKAAWLSTSVQLLRRGARHTTHMLGPHASVC